MKIKMLSSMSSLVKTAVIMLALAGVSATTYAAPILFQGHDAGAGSLGAAPNSTAAALAFDTAYSGLSVVDFESAVTPGFSFTPDGNRTMVGAGCGAALCGYNTTVAGSWFMDATFNTTFNFASPIDTFGAYFTGVQRGDATLTYTDGSTTTLVLPAATLGSGGTSFFGFSDLGASIASIAYFTGTGGDFVGVDDIRYGNARAAVPEPSILILLALGLLGLGLNQRKRLS